MVFNCGGPWWDEVLVVVVVVEEGEGTKLVWDVRWREAYRRKRKKGSVRPHCRVS